MERRPLRHERGLLPAGWWEMTTAGPAPGLRGQVLGYTGWAESSAVPLRRRELPSGAVTLILSFGPRLEVVGMGRPRSFVAGLHDRAVTTKFTGDQHGVQVDLGPLSARRLLGVPMHEVAHAVVELEDVLGPDGRALPERLAAAAGWEARFALLDAVLGARLAAAAEPPPGVAWAWGRLVASGGRAPVAGLAAELGWSSRRLLRSFRDHVGLAPKRFARVLRFRRAVTILERREARSLVDVALSCGFYDQAHMDRDFRAFAGGPPTDLLARLRPDVPGVVGS